MTELDIRNIIFSDLSEKDDFPNVRPFLAHYTTLANIEKILANDEVWFSNPLFMNDKEELRFGLNESLWAFRESKEIKELKQYDKLITHFEHFYKDFDDNYALDTYVFCLSNHENVEDNDGLLSMWRGYGENGSGAALILDTSKFEVVNNNGLIIAKVFYATTKERLTWIDKKLKEFASLIVQNNLNEKDLWVAVYYLFERFKLFALFTKHKGFDEEKEWRIVYDKRRDTQKLFDSMFGYAMTKNGIEPKLKFNVNHKNKLALESYINKIILGPSFANNLSLASFKRMLQSINKVNLVEKVVTSSIPYRK